jgi:hypothetical protein
MPASATQLRWMPPARPLDERLGATFFRQLPRRPGVYRMFGADGTLLYVGKAGDLRQRLSSYRSLTQASRKTIRLVHAVRAITWEVCATEEAATLLENALLRAHRPRFNRVGVWPQANGYLEFLRSGDGVELRFVRPPGSGSAPPPETGEFRRLFGAFKPAARLACAALARLLWGYGEDWPEPARLPRRLLASAPNMGWSVRPGDHQTEGLLLALLAGESAELLNRWVGFAEVPGSPFLREFWRRDWEAACEFYRTGPARNRALRAHFGVGDPRGLIGPSELDDLLVRWQRRGSA